MTNSRCSAKEICVSEDTKAPLKHQGSGGKSRKQLLGQWAHAFTHLSLSLMNFIKERCWRRMKFDWTFLSNILPGISFLIKNKQIL